ncbi:MAG: hypothetical protein RID81_06915 [Sandaracinaceae bacterium]
MIPQFDDDFRPVVIERRRVPPEQDLGGVRVAPFAFDVLAVQVTETPREYVVRARIRVAMAEDDLPGENAFVTTMARRDGSDREKADAVSRAIATAFAHELTERVRRADGRPWIEPHPSDAEFGEWPGCSTAGPLLAGLTRRDPT